VLQDIRNLDCSKDFFLLNFQESTYKNDQNKKQPQYLMTKDGFTFLVMGYRGKKAAQFKEAYIKRFNDMEQFIKSLLATKMEFPAFTAAVMAAHEEPKHYHYSNEINAIYRIVLGVDAKTFRVTNGIDKGGVIRPYLSLGQIKAIENLQRINIGLLVAIPDFQQRKQILTAQHNRKLSIAG
jgi:phage regulator Rha-like protein